MIKLSYFCDWCKQEKPLENLKAIVMVDRDRDNICDEFVVIDDITIAETRDQLHTCNECRAKMTLALENNIGDNPEY